MTKKQIGAEEYAQFCDLLEQRSGIVLGLNKQYLVRSRLLPLMDTYNFDSLSGLLDAILRKRSGAMVDAAVDAMTTNETLWFRDSYPFNLLGSSLFEQYESMSRPLRIWCAACSSGQEPYSIAMTVLEYLARKGSGLRNGIQILGTDLSPSMLKKCETGVYDKLSISRGLSEERQRQFFDTHGYNEFIIKPEVRKLVSFRSLNLMDSYTSLGTFDIIFCRNVLIYFDSELKAKILQKLASSLTSDGILFLGASESLSGLCDDFTMVRCNPGLYYKKKQ